MEKLTPRQGKMQISVLKRSNCKFPLCSEDLISPNPYERVVELWINGLQVLEDQLLVQHALIERQRKAGVDELAVEKCLDEKIKKEIHIHCIKYKTAVKWDLQATHQRSPRCHVCPLTIAMKRPMKQK